MLGRPKNMRVKKHNLALLGMLLIAVLSLGACGQNNQNAITEEAETTPSEQSQAPSTAADSSPEEEGESDEASQEESPLLGNIPPEFTQASASNTRAPEDYQGEHLTYYADYVLDNNFSTAWNDGDLRGYDQWIEIHADEPQQVSALKIAAGYQKREEVYFWNYRPKDIKVTLSDGSSYFYKLEDRFNTYQTLELPESASTTTIRIEILSTYAGNKYDDCCITEIKAVYDTGSESQEPTTPNWQAAYSAVLDNPNAYEWTIFGGGSSLGPYRYALVEMDGDSSVPELLLGKDFNLGTFGTGTDYHIFTFDAGSNSAQLVDGELGNGDKMLLGVPADNDGLISIFIGPAAAGNGQTRVRVSGGTLNSSPVAVEVRDLNTRDISDRSLLGNGTQSSAAELVLSPIQESEVEYASEPVAPSTPAPAIQGAAFDCEYFTVYVPSWWGDNWSVSNLGNNTWSFGQSADGNGAATVTVTNGNAPYTSVAGTTSGGLTVYINEAAAGFFGNGQATIVLK